MTQHLHDAEPSAAEAAKCSARMCHAVQSAPGTRPSAVLASELLAVPAAARAAIGGKDTVRQRHRCQKRGMHGCELCPSAAVDMHERDANWNNYSPVFFDWRQTVDVFQ